jgi:hypothetical protein
VPTRTEQPRWSAVPSSSHLGSFPMRKCMKCDCEIPAVRLEALPYTTTCVKCSTTKAYVGFMSFAHKTAPDIVMVNPDDRENLRRAVAIHERRR